MTIQEHLNFPSLKKEILPFLSEHMITDVSSFSKKSWKSLVDSKIKEANRRFLLDGMKRYSKIDFNSISCEEYGLKPYFKTLSLSNSRMKFRIRTNSVKSCRLHFPSNPQFIKEMFICPEPGCSMENSEAPCLDNLLH